ncbi:MAG: PD-(D/E)XK nuclease family transposase [Candidatus Kapaibacterium sp.]
MVQDRSIHLLTDFGLKKTFGAEQEKDRCIDYMNQIVPEKHHRVDVRYAVTDDRGAGEQDRKAVVNVSCTSQRGEAFLGELQQAMQHYFKDRSVYPSTFPVQEQTLKGEGITPACSSL